MTLFLSGPIFVHYRRDLPNVHELQGGTFQNCVHTVHGVEGMGVRCSRDPRFTLYSDQIDLNFEGYGIYSLASGVLR
jgi:hypothetical protein